jgi:hypothetical protein
MFAASNEAIELLPAIVNSKGEIGWKVQPQNSKLRQEVL